jgi:hypothetical protein
MIDAFNYDISIAKVVSVFDLSASIEERNIG